MKKFAIFILCAAMVLCAFGCARDIYADSDTNNEADSVSTNGMESSENESSNSVCDGDITIEIVTENIMSETETITISVESTFNTYVSISPDLTSLSLYKLDDGETSLVNSIVDNYTSTLIDSGLAGNAKTEFEIPIADWYGELDTGEYLLEIDFYVPQTKSSGSSSVTFTVE